MITEKDIRLSMRISHNALDEEIQRNMDTCLLDLERVGVNVDAESNLLDKACELYCKAQFDYQGKASDFLTNYEKLRDAMSLSGGYKDV